MQEYTSSYKKKYPKLYYFFSSSFHQDWILCHDWKEKKPDWKVAVTFFMRNNPEKSVTQATKELEQLLSEDLNDNLFEEALDELRSNIYAPGLGYKTYRAWAEDILEVLKKS